nr:MAG TPA: hypothetical protein [Caudoviricetes sp.]
MRICKNSTSSSFTPCVIFYTTFNFTFFPFV